MRLTVLHMLSTSSLQAFSNATTTGGVGRSSGTEGIRLVRNQPDQVARQAEAPRVAIPDSRPSLPPPRGSLLNLSV